MKAIKVCEYGVDAAQLADAAKPVPNDNQVLIKVRAASLNALDVFMIRDTWFGRLFFGLRKPRNTGLGRDVAGPGGSSRQERDPIQTRRRSLRPL